MCARKIAKPAFLTGWLYQQKHLYNPPMLAAKAIK
jgi:hypothetical protein